MRQLHRPIRQLNAPGANIWSAATCRRFVMLVEGRQPEVPDLTKRRQVGALQNRRLLSINADNRSTAYHVNHTEMVRRVF